MYVSVIVPTRNHCESLRNTIASLQQLNFPNDRYEIIVIDNNSTDDTRRVVEEGKQQGKKEIIYCKELRVGLHYARHAGAKIAKGDILAYTDDDVICDPDGLQSSRGLMPILKWDVSVERFSLVLKQKSRRGPNTLISSMS